MKRLSDNKIYFIKKLSTLLGIGYFAHEEKLNLRLYTADIIAQCALILTVITDKISPFSSGVSRVLLHMLHIGTVERNISIITQFT